jgi:hypothetical protein
MILVTWLPTLTGKTPVLRSGTRGIIRIYSFLGFIALNRAIGAVDNIIYTKVNTMQNSILAHIVLILFPQHYVVRSPAVVGHLVGQICLAVQISTRIACGVISVIRPEILEWMRAPSSPFRGAARRSPLFT